MIVEILWKKEVEAVGAELEMPLQLGKGRARRNRVPLAERKWRKRCYVRGSLTQ
jgi:hypothetical protein